MWQEIGLIGRDDLLTKEIHPRVSKKLPFFLTGYAGTGKTAILQWAHENYNGKKAYISSTWTMKEILVSVAKQWDLKIVEDEKEISISKASISRLEEVITNQSNVAIFIDHINKATPTKIRRYQIWKERFTLYFAGTPPYREEIRPLLWGLKEIQINPIAKEDRERLALAMCNNYEATVSHLDVVQASRGIPGRMAAMVIGNEVEDTSERVEGEEHDISWTLLVLVAVIVSVRYIGMGLGRFDLYVLGGLFMALGLIVRYFLFRFQKK
jgi:hypothetical protein